MGRFATGLKRAIPFQLSFDPQEDEYLKRVSFQMKISRAEFFRSLLFPRTWQKDLVKLRLKQRDLSKKLQAQLNGK